MRYETVIDQHIPIQQTRQKTKEWDDDTLHHSTNQTPLSKKKNHYKISLCIILILVIFSVLHDLLFDFSKCQSYSGKWRPAWRLCIPRSADEISQGSRICITFWEFWPQCSICNVQRNLWNNITKLLACQLLLTYEQSISPGIAQFFNRESWECS